jgi:NAD(P)-dependent dehydrogenase (short-subunit alcohol dehydrogenase family)
MNDALGYEGKSVVVTGTASGMGRATAQILVDLGANVTAIDLNPTEVPVETGIQLDLRDQSAIHDAVASITGTVDSVFSCAGLPGPPFSELDTMIVNFVGARELIEGLIPQIPEAGSVGCISSAAAYGWQNSMPTLVDFTSNTTWDTSLEWLKANEEAWGFSGYWFSKQVLDYWVSARGTDLMTEKKIRLNAINPGPTETGMMPAFQALAGKELIDSSMGPIQRYSAPEEQAWPLVLLNSPRMSYVCCEVLWTDGGFQGANVSGKQGGFAA